MKQNEFILKLNFPLDTEIAGRTISAYIEEVHGLYKADNRPWVIGYSGGKDSTAILQLVYLAILSLPEAERQKPVFVVSSDTLVETPLIVNHITGTLGKIQAGANTHGLNLHTQQVTPKIKETFWVNLIGKGYPAPTKNFRWCTERMKINPVSEFILNRVAEFGEVVVVLGSRSAESSSRAQVIQKHKIEGKRLAKHVSLPNAYVYTPIEEWSADDVWEFLFTGSSPWGGNHQALFDLYKDSNAGECPLVIDTSTPSCGNSRFGCWVCTVVNKDKAMDGLIESGHTWLMPLQDFRNQLHNTTLPENKSEFRNFKRRSGKVTAVGMDEDFKVIPGPYWMSYRKDLLKKLLEAQKEARKEDPKLELITFPELEEIRNAWMHDPNEPDWEDCLPKIYEEVMNEKRDWAESDAGAFTKLDADLLQELEATHKVPAALVMKLIELELSMDGLSKRSAVFDRIGQLLNRDWVDLDEVLEKHQAANKVAHYLEQEEETLKEQYANYESLKSNVN